MGLIYNIFATENNLYAFTKSGRWLTFSVEDGTYNLSEPFPPYLPFLVDDGVMYLYEGQEFKAKEVDTSSILWEYSITDDFDPIFTDNILIILEQKGNIYGLDKHTGELLWNINSQVISNVATDESHLYFFTNDGYLTILDINTGQRIERLEFSSASYELNSPPSGNIIGAYNLWVDSQNDIVVVSFGDSCQLMALKIQNK